MPLFLDNFIIIYQELPNKFNEFNEILQNIYKEIKEKNLTNVITNIQPKDIINYSFSKTGKNSFVQENYNDNGIIIDKIQNKSDLIFLLNSINNSEGNKILNFKFTKKYLNKIISLNKIIKYR